MTGSKVEDLHRRWKESAKYRRAYEDLREEFERYARRLRREKELGA